MVCSRKRIRDCRCRTVDGYHDVSPNDLLVKVDIATMANSLEGEVSFLDHHVIEFAASLPEKYKLRGLTPSIC